MDSETKTIGCRNPEPALAEPKSIPERVSLDDNGVILDLPQDEAIQPELELDPETDPIVPSPSYLDSEWERQIKSIQVRKPSIPPPEEQKDRILWILGLLDSEKPEPEPWQVEESLNWLSNLESIIPDHNEFVASSFQHFYPAWKELLKGVHRKSARSVLSWIRSGFNPKFAGTEQAKPEKREIVESMLRRVVRPHEVPRMLSGRFPHTVEFQNHQSLYTNWGFSMEQIFKLVQWGSGRHLG